MKKGAISDRDLKALLCLGMLAMLALTFFLGFQVFLKDYRETKTENNQLEMKLNDLREKDRNKQTYKTETEQFNKQIKAMVMQFPSKVTTEKVIFDLDGLRKKLGQMQFDSITLNMNSIFYPEQQATPDAETASLPVNEEGTVAGYQDGNVIVYCSEITVGFESLTYKSLKELVQEVRDYDGRMTIDSTDIEFDGKTGLLTGSFVFKFYSLEGSPNEYQVPDITNISSGLKNIFGSFDK